MTEKDDLDFIAGSGKSILSYVNFPKVIFLVLNPRQAPRSSRTLTACARPVWPHWVSIFLTFAIQTRSNAAGCSRLCFASFLISPTPTITSSPIFIQHTVMADKAPMTRHSHSVSKTSSVLRDKHLFTSFSTLLTSVPIPQTHRPRVKRC